MKKKSIKKFNSLEKQKDIKEIVNFILEYRALKHLPRASLVYLKGPIKENVAEHSFYVTIISWLMARLEGGNEDKAIKMGLVHDLGEVRGGEKNLINKFYTTPLNEPGIIKEISRDYEFKKFPLFELFQEYNEAKTPEAKIAKDADILAQMLLEKECYELGNQSASKWLYFSLTRLKTKLGKKLGKHLIKVKGDKWWLEINKKYILKTKFL